MPTSSREAALIEKNAEFILQDLRLLIAAIRILEEDENSPLRAARYDTGPGDPNTISDPTAAASMSLVRSRAKIARMEAWAEVRKASLLLGRARHRLERAVGS